jgi:signal transduction histidine kinase/DNA-binding response OmpR family regulator
VGRGPDRRAESRRILIGAAALLMVGVVALNVALFHEARERVEREAWARLDASADWTRDEVARRLQTFTRESRSVVEDPSVRAGLLEVVHAGATELPAATQSELRARSRLFGMDAVELVDAAGRAVAVHGDCDCMDAASRSVLAARALVQGEPLLADPDGDELVLAAPLGQDHDGHAALLLVHDHGSELAGALQYAAQGLEARSGAFLVRPEGSLARVLTEQPALSRFRVGDRLALDEPEAMLVAMAASGVESRAEDRGPDGRPLWAVTRQVPGHDWGVVVLADQEGMLAGLQEVWQGLLLLDLLLVGLLAASGWLWWRFYRTGIARHEAEVTERHARRVQAILDTAFDAILTYDRTGRIRAVNRAAERLFGCPAAQLEGLALDQVLAFGDDGGVPSAGSVGLGRVLRHDEPPIPVECSVGATVEQGETLFTAIVRDVRERVDAERRLRSFAEGLEVANRRLEEMNAQLEEASRLKSEFLANTSHELRTPLNGMIGFLQLVLDGMCDSPEEEREFLQQSLQCSRHLLGLINDVLDIAKIEAGKLALEVERIDMTTLFGEVYTVTHVQAQQKGVELRFDCQVRDGVVARGDFHKVKQVLINLVGNSLKFTPKGRITVRAKAHEELGHFMVEVVDTGIGIAPDRQKLIFEKFVQADGSTTRRFGGTGLGLAISRSLVELMGGIIGVHSEGEGRGTRMYFSLPMWRDEAPSAPATGGLASDTIRGPAGGALVLVVEDDPVFRRFLTAVLQQSGYRTVEADHAEAGWMLARRLHPAVIVLDYALSCGDGAALRTGWDLAQRLTGEDETRHIPLVFVTGFDGELKEKLRANAFARRPEHLVKPIDAATLIERIQAVAAPREGAVVRVLMADDDPTVGAYIRKVLSPERFHLEIATHGEECLHILRTQPHAYDLLLLDLMMPEVSGYDVLREMALTGIRPDLPVLVLTNFPEPRNAEERRLLEQGLVLDVIAKSSVHENPQLLPHVLDWHLQVARGDGEAPQAEAA